MRHAAVLECLHSAVNAAVCSQRMSLLAMRDKLERRGPSHRTLRAGQGSWGKQRKVPVTKSLAQNTKCHFACGGGNDRQRKPGRMPDAPLSGSEHLPDEKTNGKLLHQPSTGGKGHFIGVPEAKIDMSCKGWIHRCHSGALGLCWYVRVCVCLWAWVKARSHSVQQLQEARGYKAGD